MSDLSGALEALLFVSDEPLSAATMAGFLEKPVAEVSASLAELAERWQNEERGIQLREVAGGWRLYTHPAYHQLVERYVLSWDTRTLSQAALEALAVIAYHQPATRSQVNSVRGVNSEGVIASLVEKGLVREMGRDANAGNAILYGTTRVFLERFGLKTLKDLPPLEDFAPDEESREFIRARLTGGAAADGSGDAAAAKDTAEDDAETLEFVD
ncbi:MAG: SMC-Scp complex subunit ScpB [Coriobacteriales bacterium]|jgi:segregation and condensation protein B|nr:SMC-Scp complex subunit ScpB [Coriobacteriales bacterium]